MSAGERGAPGDGSGLDGTGSGVRVRLNDAPRAYPARTTVLEALRAEGIAERAGVAVAVGGAVLPRADWGGRALRDGDELLVIQATQGG